jgi:hypothetical protein
MLMEERRSAAVLWYAQGDAAVEDDDAKRHEGKSENDPSALFIRGVDKGQVRESRSPKNGVCDSFVASIVGGPLMQMSICS